MKTLPKDRAKLLQDKAFDIIDKIDIEKLVEDIDTAELAYILAFVDNILTIKANMTAQRPQIVESKT